MTLDYGDKISNRQLLYIAQVYDIKITIRKMNILSQIIKRTYISYYTTRIQLNKLEESGYLERTNTSEPHEWKLNLDKTSNVKRPALDSWWEIILLESPILLEYAGVSFIMMTLLAVVSNRPSIVGEIAIFQVHAIGSLSLISSLALFYVLCFTLSVTATTEFYASYINFRRKNKLSVITNAVSRLMP